MKTLITTLISAFMFVGMPAFAGSHGGGKMDDKKMDQQKKKIQMQKIRDLTVRLAAARKGVY